MDIVCEVDLINLFWWSLRKSPEEIAIFSLHIERIGMNKLPDIVSKVFVELSDCFSNTVIKVTGLVLYHVRNCGFFLAFCSRHVFGFYHFL